MSALALTLAIEQTIRCEDVVAIADAASEAILRVYNAGEEAWGVEAKADASPLTRADQDANDVICAGLARIGACLGSASMRFCALALTRCW